MTQPDISITFDYQERDNDAFQEWFLRTAPYNRKKIRNWQITFVGLGLLFLIGGISFLFNGLYDEGGAGPIITYSCLIYGPAMIVLTLTWLPGRMRRNALRQVKKLRRKLGYEGRYGRRSIEIAGDTFRCTFPTGTIQLNIRSMQEPVSTDTHCFFFSDPVTAYIVPCSGVESGDLDALIARFRELRAAALAVPR